MGKSVERKRFLRKNHFVKEERDNLRKFPILRSFFLLIKIFLIFLILQKILKNSL